ncbi:MAG TPA: peptide chain release factor N(5)-glutamine methyltransferase [Acidimicrobiales bacterium]|nr:peptide chain release factor N(5)-glutamine methyltransferase [Acidimicrobiales bacterium]
MSNTTTWRTVLNEAVAKVGDVDGRRLVEQASGYDGAEVVLHLDEIPTQRSLAYFDVMLARRIAGEPLQYVLGRWGFRSLDLMVDPRVLIPRPETEEVAGAAIAEARRLGASTVVDLGTGAGGIALSMAVELPGVEVWATDVSADAIEVARANLAGIGRAATRVQLRVGSWYEALPDDLRGRIDVIAANPPYVPDTAQLPPDVADWEPDVALYATNKGTDHAAVVIDGAPSWLARPGALVMEHAAWMGEEMVERALAAGFDEAAFHHDMTERERYIVARIG